MPSLTGRRTVRCSRNPEPASSRTAAQPHRTFLAKADLTRGRRQAGRENLQYARTSGGSHPGLSPSALGTSRASGATPRSRHSSAPGSLPERNFLDPRSSRFTRIALDSRGRNPTDLDWTDRGRKSCCGSSTLHEESSSRWTLLDRSARPPRTSPASQWLLPTR